MPLPPWPMPSRPAARAAVPACATVAFLMAAAAPAVHGEEGLPTAQRAPYPTPNVTVDLSVLDALGPADRAWRSGPGSVQLRPPTTHAPAATPPQVDRRAATPPKPTAAVPVAAPPMPRARPAAAMAAIAPPKMPSASTRTERPATTPEERAIGNVPPETPTGAAPERRPVSPAPRIAVRAPVRTVAFAPTQTTAGVFAPSQVVFHTRRVEFSDADIRKLEEMASRLKRDSLLRLELLAFAAEGALSPSEARRLSLTRALAVRSRLIEHGVLSTRIAVRALGGKSMGGPPDRVDLIVSAR